MVDSVFLLRHGIRLNHDDPKYFRAYLKRVVDVPLSYRGIEQARETAEFLQSKNEKISHVFCSPFFRTLQTAHEIADLLDLDIKVENGLMEVLNPNWMNDYPELLDKKERKVVFPRVDMEYESFVQPTFPETLGGEKIYKRVEETIHYILKNYEGTILIVGHGASVKASAVALLSLGPIDHVNMKMCALNKFTRDGDNWRHVYGTTDHLSKGSFE